MRLIDVDIEIAEEDAIMTENEAKKDEDPDAFFNYAMARNLKIYLLGLYYRQHGKYLQGKWEASDFGERCSVCRMPRSICELNGECVSCGAKMDGEEDDG